MKKVAIFTEGQSDQIFVRGFLTLTLGWDKISFECFRLSGDKSIPALPPHKNPNAEMSFLLLNAGSDEGVITAVNEREKGLIQAGYEKIIALRDMYSQKYDERSCGVIDKNVTREFVDGANITIRNMSDPSKIKMHFAIMELEAWFLGMYNIFEKIDSRLTVDYIDSNLGFNLKSADPQKQFFHPTRELGKVLALVSREYDKSRDAIEGICSKINTSDVSNAFENGRCNSFKNFCDEILN